jgi:hypothetical protein
MINELLLLAPEGLPWRHLIEDEEGSKFQREYAEEAMRWSRQSKTEDAKNTLIDLALTWTQAALLSEGKSVDPLRA